METIQLDLVDRIMLLIFAVAVLGFTAVLAVAIFKLWVIESCCHKL